MKRTLLPVALVGLLAATLSAGCYSRSSVGVGVSSAPPAGYYNDYYDGYYDGNVWVQGRWVWTASGWQWYDGYWMPARPGFVYVQGYWNWGGGHWHYRPGNWIRARPGYTYVAGHWSYSGGRRHWVDGRWAQNRHGYRYVQPRYDHRTGRKIRGGWSRVRDNRGRSPTGTVRRQSTPRPQYSTPPRRSSGSRDHRSGGRRTRDHRR